MAALRDDARQLRRLRSELARRPRSVTGRRATRRAPRFRIVRVASVRRARRRCAGIGPGPDQVESEVGQLSRSTRQYGRMESPSSPSGLPPPRRRCPAATGIAWMLCGIAGLVVAMLVLSVLLGGGRSKRRVVGDSAECRCRADLLWERGPHRYRDWPSASPSLGALSGARRTPLRCGRVDWLGGVYDGQSARATRHRRGGYVVLGALAWALMFSVAVVPLMLRSTTRSFAGPVAGWYPDPVRQTRWRWWDGTGWSAYSA